MAGGAAVYNLRLPPKASGKDTGAGPAPGFMRLTPDSRAPAKADPSARAGFEFDPGGSHLGRGCAYLGLGWRHLGGSTKLLLLWLSSMFFVVVVVLVFFCCCCCGCCCCGCCWCCCCCWPMLALFGRSFAPVLALGWPM